LDDAKGVDSLFSQNFDCQIDYTFNSELPSSGTEAWIDFLLGNFVWASINWNSLEMFSQDAGNVGTRVV
jgi:hypothetical protein